MSGEKLTREERLRCFDELVYSITHGIEGVGWKTQTWGMLTTIDQVHKIFEEIMQRPVWTNEMGSTGIKMMREELSNGMDAPNPLESYSQIKRVLGTGVES